MDSCIHGFLFPMIEEVKVGEGDHARCDGVQVIGEGVGGGGEDTETGLCGKERHLSSKVSILASYPGLPRRFIRTASNKAWVQADRERIS